MAHWWLQNKAKGEGGGGSGGGHGRLKLSSQPERVFIPHQAYWTLYKETKIRQRFLEVREERNGAIDNTDHLGIDEGLVDEPDLTSEQEHAEEDRCQK